MNITQKKEALKDGIAKYAPVVAEFFARDDSLSDYSRHLYKGEVDGVHLARQQDIKQAITWYIATKFDQNIQVSLPLVTNVVDHQAVLNHPLLIATNVVANAYRLVDDSINTDPIVVLTSSIVPPNNFFNKKGFAYAGKKIPLFSNTQMHQASCFIPLHDFHFISRLKDMGTWKDFGQVQQRFLTLLEEEITALDFSLVDDYCGQIGVINKMLWPRLFDQEIRDTISDLYYVPQEDIMKVLLPSILQNDNLISWLLFNEQFRQEIIVAFRGLIGCWDEDKAKGTHFFWLRGQKNEIERLYLKHDCLLSADQSIKIPLTISDLVPLIETRQIVPNLFMIFTYLTFWCGLKPLVGHGSCNYLTQMKNKWMGMLEKYDREEYDRISNINTKGLIGGAMVTFGRDQTGQIVSRYALDVITQGGLSKDYLHRLFKMKYRDLLAPALLEIYDSYVPPAEKKDLQLRTNDMLGSEFAWIK